MPNLATAQAAIPVGYKHSGLGAYIIPILCTFDTADSDLTIYTPQEDCYLALVGLQYSEADAHSLTIKSGSTTLITYQMPANSGKDFGIGNGLLCSSLAKGEALKLRCTTATIATILAHVMEYKQLQFA